MAMRRSFAERIGYVWTCVAPATLLSDERSSDEPESLREVASTDGLCYVQVLRPLAAGSCYLARVAATPDRLHTHAFTLVLSEDDLRFTLAYDCRIQGKHPQQILAMMDAHANALAPLFPLSDVLPDEALVAPPVADIPSVAPAAHVVCVLKPVPLPEPLVLSSAQLQAAIQSVRSAQPSRSQAPSMNVKSPSLPSLSSPHVQQALLSVAIDMLMSHLVALEQQAQAIVLHARCALLASIQRWHRQSQQRVVSLLPCYEDEQRQPLWQLLIEGPVGVHVPATS